MIPSRRTSEMRVEFGKGMAEQTRFQKMEAEMLDDDNLWTAMKEQAPSMLAMAGMFIVTILLAVYLQPFFHGAGLHAFGEEGTSQVRYVALELALIFAFTAGILALAKWKKDWLIKYGLMTVLFIALLYTLVPLTHLIMVPDSTDSEFEIDSTSDSDLIVLAAPGANGLLTTTTIENEFGNKSHKIQYWEDGENIWTHTRLWIENDGMTCSEPCKVTVVLGPDAWTFADDGGFIWSLNPVNGSVISDIHDCVGPHLRAGCVAAFEAFDDTYMISTDEQLVRFHPNPTLNHTNGKWRLPLNLDLRQSTGLLMHKLPGDQLLLVSRTSAIIFDIPTAVENPDPVENIGDIHPTWQYNSSITAAYVGDSIYDENDKLILVGNDKGSITAIKVSENYVEKETRINLGSAFSGPISSLRVMDWNGDNISETWILAGDGIHMLEGKSQVERIVGSVDFEGEIAMVFNSQTLEFYQFDSFADATTMMSGPVNEDLLLDGGGIVIYTVPALIALIIAILLMVALYIHPEWYVVNTVGILVGSGVIVMLGVAFVPTLIILFMVLAAIYDAWAVYRSKHMIELADTMIGLKLPILLVAPQERGYTMLEEKQSIGKTTSAETKSKPKKKKSNDAMFMGLGDIIFPGMLVISTLTFHSGTEAWWAAMMTMLGGLVGYFTLMTYVARGRPQAGLPLLNGGAILGYILGVMIFIGAGGLEPNISL